MAKRNENGAAEGPGDGSNGASGDAGAAVLDEAVSEVVQPTPAPWVGEIVRYVLDGDDKKPNNKGQVRAGIVTLVHDGVDPEKFPGCVNLTVFPGKQKDFGSAEIGAPTTMPGRNYDPNGAPGTWHRRKDPAGSR